MKRVLVVAYFFPPHRGIGGKRMAKLVQQLPRVGWEPIVLTTPIPPMAERDLSLPDDLQGVRMERSYAPTWLWEAYHGSNEAVASSKGSAQRPAKPWAGLLSKAEKLLHANYPFDAKIWFAPSASVEAVRLASKYRVDAAIVTAAPHSSFLVARALQRVNIPTLLDFRDPWRFNFEMQKKAAWLRAYEAGFETILLQQASGVVFASENTRQAYLEVLPNLQQKSRTIYSGYEELHGEIAPWPGGDRPTVGLVHFGDCYGPRKLGLFVDALARLVRTYRLQPRNLRVLLLGKVQQSDLLRAEDRGVRGFLQCERPLPYQEGLAALRGADALLYCDPGRERLYVAGKFFDYLQIQRPIYAISASEEMCGLIERHGLGVHADPDDEVALYENLERCWRERGLPYEGRDLQQLSVGYAASQWAESLESIRTP